MMTRTTFAAAAGLLLSLGVTGLAQVTTSGAGAFDARAAKHRGGVFFTAEDIQKRSPARVSDLFRNLSGITLSTSDGGKVILTSSRGPRAGLVASTTSGVAGMTTPASPSEPSMSPTVTGQHCPVLVGMDGQMMDPAFSVDDVPVSSVHGIEVYTGSARVPVEFGAANNSGCGVVMIWSKTGGSGS